MVTTARQVFGTIDVYPSPWVPDAYPTRNIFIAAADTPREAGWRAEGGLLEKDTLSAVIARTRPVEVEEGRVLTDDSAPLELLVRRTTEILRNRVREYIPIALLIR